MEQGWVDWGWNQQGDAALQRLKAGYDRIFHHLLPGVISAEDPDHPYWPSSASSGIPFSEPNAQQRGDTHYWDVWHGRKPFTAYRQQFPRFMSEFGFQSLPPFKTIQVYAALEDQNMTSYVMEHHQRSGNGNTLMMSQMADNFRMPKDFQSLVYMSMVLQAEGIRYGVEHWRRNRQRVGGTLYWQLNDCWPVASWSSVDYFGRWKALHYAAKRFYAPLLLSVENESTRMSIHVTSDLTAAWDGMVRWSLQSLDGRILKKGKSTVHAEPLADTAIRTLDFSAEITDANRRSTVFACELWQGDELVSVLVSTFVPDKHLSLAKPELRVDVSLVDQTLTFDLSSDTLARFVELSLEGADVVFTDNYFDLPAGLGLRVTAPIPPGWNLEQARQAVSVWSLYNAYA
jgi:beta-mannosidase